MKTTRKALPLICLMMTVMLLMASCDLSFIPGLNSDSTTPAPQTAETTPQTGTSNNSPQETPIDISKIPESQGLAYEIPDEGIFAVTGIGTCIDSVVRIPETIDGYRVTHLAWFGEEAGLEETLEQIDRVTTIIIPKTVTGIFSEMFVRGNLNAIVVDPENPIYYSEGNCVIEKISKTLVLGCNGSVIPKDVKRIGDYAFAYCTGLRTLTIPAGVTSIGDDAFAYCPALANITFEGTKAEWSSLAFNPADLYIGEFYTIHCTDGDIVIEGGDSTCEHSFRSDCAEYCYNCYGDRKTEIDHTYSSSSCNERCEVCGGGYRKTYNHIYSSACDEDCDVCGGGYREDAADHTYSFDCDEHCDVCNDYRYIEDDLHVFSSDCDRRCDVCDDGYRNTYVDHLIDYDVMYPDRHRCLLCDDNLIDYVPPMEGTNCNSCGHFYIRTCNYTTCEKCGAEVSRGWHYYSGKDDPSCYYCGEIRSLN